MADGKGAAFVGGAGAVLLVGALLFGGAKLGLGGGGEGILPVRGGSGQNETVQTEDVSSVTQDAGQESALTQSEALNPSEEPTGEAEDDGILTITVREGQILYRGEVVDLDGLEQYLLEDYTQDIIVTLSDDHAIKSVYDDVQSLLQRLEIAAQ